MSMSSVTQSDTTPTPDHCSLPRKLLALGLVAPGYIPPCLRQPACFCTGTPLRPVRLPENLSTRVNFGYRRHMQRQRKQNGTSLTCVIPCQKGCPQETPNNSSIYHYPSTQPPGTGKKREGPKIMSARSLRNYKLGLQSCLFSFALAATGTSS